MTRKQKTDNWKARIESGELSKTSELYLAADFMARYDARPNTVKWRADWLATSSHCIISMAKCRGFKWS